MQRCLFKKITTPLFNGVKGEGGMGLKAAGMAKERLAKAVYAPKFSWFSCALFAGVIVR